MNVFQKQFSSGEVGDRYKHLENFFSLVPALTLNYVDHIVAAKEKMAKTKKESSQSRIVFIASNRCICVAIYLKTQIAILVKLLAKRCKKLPTSVVENCTTPSLKANSRKPFASSPRVWKLYLLNRVIMNVNLGIPARFQRENDRAGAAAVEFALTVPLLFLVAFGCIEMTRYNLLKNVAHQAAFESARIGVKPGATVQEVIDEAKDQMKYVCSDCVVQVSPTEITSNTDEITVVIQVDIRQQGWITPQYFSDPIMEAVFTIRRDNVSTY